MMDHAERRTWLRLSTTPWVQVVSKNLLLELYDMIEELETESRLTEDQALTALAEAKVEIERLEAALREISQESACEGPDCHYCETDQHHPMTRGAHIALRALHRVPA